MRKLIFLLFTIAPHLAQSQIVYQATEGRSRQYNLDYDEWGQWTAWEKCFKGQFVLKFIENKVLLQVSDGTNTIDLYLMALKYNGSKSNGNWRTYDGFVNTITNFCDLSVENYSLTQLENGIRQGRCQIDFYGISSFLGGGRMMIDLKLQLID